VRLALLQRHRGASRLGPSIESGLGGRTLLAAAAHLATARPKFAAWCPLLAPPPPASAPEAYQAAARCNKAPGGRQKALQPRARCHHCRSARARCGGGNARGCCRWHLSALPCLTLS
jgi:hypothetical protein